MAHVLPVQWKVIKWKSSQTSLGLILLNIFINALGVVGWKPLMKFSADTRRGVIVSVEIMSSSSHTGSVRAGTMKQTESLIAEVFCL